MIDCGFYIRPVRCVSYCWLGIILVYVYALSSLTGLGFTRPDDDGTGDGRISLMRDTWC
jgi:hypothetical protein